MTGEFQVIALDLTRFFWQTAMLWCKSGQLAFPESGHVNVPNVMPLGNLIEGLNQSQRFKSHQQPSTILVVRNLLMLNWQLCAQGQFVSVTCSRPHSDLANSVASLRSLAGSQPRYWGSQSIETCGGCLSQNLLKEAGDQPAQLARFRTFKPRTSCFPVLVKHESADQCLLVKLPYSILSGVYNFVGPVHATFESRLDAT